LAEGEHQSRLAASDRASHANRKGPLLKVSAQRLLAGVKMPRMIQVFMGMAVGTVVMVVFVAHFNCALAIDVMGWKVIQLWKRRE
jgi:hypothetical protein